MKDYYKVLEVARDATQDQIKSAYYHLARRYHPDISNYEKASQLFVEINEAHDILSDPVKRKEYDEKMAREAYFGPTGLSTIQRNEKQSGKTEKEKPDKNTTSRKSKDKKSRRFELSKLVRAYSSFVLVFCILITVDFYMPGITVNEDISSVRNNMVSTPNGTEIPIPRGYEKAFDDLESLEVLKTKIFKKYKGFKLPGLFYVIKTDYSSNYGFFGLLIIILASSFVGVFGKYQSNIGGLIGIGNLVLSILLIFIFASIP